MMEGLHDFSMQRGPAAWESYLTQFANRWSCRKVFHDIFAKALVIEESNVDRGM
jgi:hypothetical protein